MLNKVITNFQEKRRNKIATKNYSQLLEKMVNYHSVVSVGSDEREILVRAVVDIENKKAAGQIDELNQLKTA